MGFAERQHGNCLPARYPSQWGDADMVRGRAPDKDTAAPLVFVVDDDSCMRHALGRLFCSAGLRVELFESAVQFLRRQRRDRPNCLVLDIRLPVVSGLDLQWQLREANIRTPIIFMTAHGDIPMSVGAMKAGAHDFLTKPFRDQDILDAVAAAVQRDKQAQQAEDAAAKRRAGYERLSVREREVVALVTSGLMNKQVAARLGVSEVTVKIHRRHAMQKVNAKSLADLVKIVGSLGLPQTRKCPEHPYFDGEACSSIGSSAMRVGR